MNFRESEKDEVLAVAIWIGGVLALILLWSCLWLMLG